jgi:hypothetical protein
MQVLEECVHQTVIHILSHARPDALLGQVESQLRGVLAQLVASSARHHFDFLR